MVTIGDDMVDPMKPQEYRKKEEMTTENALPRKKPLLIHYQKH